MKFPPKCDPSSSRAQFPSYSQARNAIHESPYLARLHGRRSEGLWQRRIAKVSVATNRSWIDKTTGDRVEKTDWVTVTILNEQDAKFALANVRKGSPIYAECRVAESSYQKDGRTIYGVDIVAEVFDLLRPPAAQIEEHAAQ